MILKGKITELHAAKPSDKADAYNWLTNSDLTSSMMGLPDFPDHPVPSYEEFLNDYALHFFDGSKPRNGQSFIIYFNGIRCGQINFDTDAQPDNIAEMDIWLAGERFTGKGIGADAIETLSDYLLDKLKFEALIIAPSKRNTRAIKAYQKAGFVFTDEITSPAPDYTDSVTMIKRKKIIAVAAYQNSPSS